MDISRKAKYWIYCLLCLIAITALGTWYFHTNYKVFYNPFQIISNSDIEKNKQGICVEENRKLSESELLQRLFAQRFERYYYMRENERPDSDRVCPDESYCYLQKLPPYTIEEYIRKYIGSKYGLMQPYQGRNDQSIDLLSSDKLFENNAYQNGRFPFSIYLEFGGLPDKFYPSDCCTVIDRNTLKKDMYEIKDQKLLNELSERGLGNYTVIIKSISGIRSNSSDFGISLFHLDNCGNFNEHFDHISDDSYEINIKKGRRYSITRNKIDKIEDISVETSCNPITLEQIIPNDLFFSYYYWHGGQFYECEN